ncbi:hypothetical protein GCM10028807_16020 [Spirosoma daeguense]
MEKKMTTTLGIALGATLLAGAGFGLYKWLSNKKKSTGVLQSAGKLATEFTHHFIGNSLIKSNSLFPTQNDNGLIGGGLVKSNASNILTELS